ncbi:MAG TPA: phosphate ABC transporter substrate-binding protein PstS [Kineosporiaceae bacterium]|nr:phosphate ABC transporter substrate-binding protein PstS [Kineosporiaceae bacterium]
MTYRVRVADYSRAGAHALKLSRSGRVAGVALVGALALAACGSDNTTPAATSAGGSSGASAAGAAVSGTLNGEGSTAQKNAITQVITDFQTTNSGATVNYNGTGSGAGIKQFNAGQVDFAGSDSALKTAAADGTKTEADLAKARCQGNDAWNLPMVAGPIAVAYNVKGVDKLVLTPEVAAKIFNGTIKTWNDPAIKAINASATLPATPIKVFFRSDESGTTENFQKYLNGAAASTWTDAPAKKWAGKVGEGKPKSDGVAAAVKGTDGAISYVEWSFATKNGLGIAQIDNGGGPVELTGESAGKAVAAAKPDGTGNDLRLKLDYATKTPGVYPIVLVTYEIVCSKGLAADKTALVKSFLTFFADPAQQGKLTAAGYAPLPPEVQTKVAAAIAAIS